jgi:hypothetical protein
MRGVVVYTVLRVALFLVAWLLVQLLTPWRGLLALAVAIIVSGVVGFFLLDRPRDQASSALHGVFRRIDERIQNNALAEDALVEASLTEGPDVLTAGRDGQAEAEQDSVDRGQGAGESQDGDQIASGRAFDDDEAGADRERQ